MSGGPIDLRDCERLIEAASNGDEVARRSLLDYMWPTWTGLVRGNRSMGRLADSDDDVREVVVRLAEKLTNDNCRALRLYLPWQRNNPDKTFEDWNRIVLANTVRDYVRDRLGPRTAPDGIPNPKRLLNEFLPLAVAQEPGVRPPFTAAEMARQLMEFARTRLSAAKIRVLELWLQGSTTTEIGRDVGVPDGDAEHLLRSSLAVLRRHFAPGKGEGPKDAERDGNPS